MAAGIFYGVQRDFLFSRSVTTLPGPQLAGRIQEAYETIKKVLYTTTSTHELWLRHSDRVCRTLDVLYVLSSYQSELFVILQSCLRL
jgi:hypothetical protein